VRTKGNK